MKKNVSILLTIHNKEFLIERVCESIVKNISNNVEEIIVVYDGCTDNSENISQNILKKFQKKLTYLYTDDVFETKANNFGLKHVESDYVIIIQDDMIINEIDFDKRMLKPFITFDDVFAVTSFRAHNDRVYSQNKIDHVDIIDGKLGYPRDKFGVREIANRGPLMYNYSDVVKLDFYDEIFSPQTYDDHDISFRAWEKLGKVSGLYWIDWYSKPEWGTTRTKSYNLIREADKKNEKIIAERWGHILNGTIINENRNLN
jgi:glycosyltransferase involved in cell wall biosynthesis